MDLKDKRDKEYYKKPYGGFYEQYIGGNDIKKNIDELIGDFIKDLEQPITVSPNQVADNRKKEAQKRINAAIAFLINLCDQREYPKKIYEYWWEYDKVKYEKDLVLRIDSSKSICYVSRTQITDKVCKALGTTSSVDVEKSITEALSNIKLATNIRGFKIISGFQDFSPIEKKLREIAEYGEIEYDGNGNAYRIESRGGFKFPKPLDKDDYVDARTGYIYRQPQPNKEKEEGDGYSIFKKLMTDDDFDPFK
jgi:hypothetical protein